MRVETLSRCDTDRASKNVLPVIHFRVKTRVIMSISVTKGSRAENTILRKLSRLEIQISKLLNVFEVSWILCSHQIVFQEILSNFLFPFLFSFYNFNFFLHQRPMFCFKEILLATMVSQLEKYNHRIGCIAAQC